MKKNYTAVGLLFGIGIGICLGVANNSLPIGLSMGIGTGFCFGIIMKKRAQKCESKSSSNNV
jgi:F0F1-type ATP synthase assembly protein I